MKAKTGLKRKYVKSSTELLVYQGQKINTLRSIWRMRSGCVCVFVALSRIIP